jgi:cytochrome b561
MAAKGSHFVLYALMVAMPGDAVGSGLSANAACAAACATHRAA